MIVLFYKRNAFADFCFGDGVSVAENYASGIFYLIVEEFAEVLHMHLAFIGVDDGRSSVKLCSVCICIFDRRNDVGELSNARGLDKYSVGMILIYNLFECLGKVTD